MAKPSIGQFSLDGEMFGLDSLVVPPEVIENDGLKVIHFAISEEDKKIPKYLDTVKEKARLLQPEVKSKGKPFYLTAEYQTRKRKQKAGAL